MDRSDVGDLTDFARAIALLREGRYREAWPLWDTRPNVAIQSRMVVGPKLWQGEPLAGQTILVVGEQGLGDEVMFARFIRPLKELAKPEKIIFAVDPLNRRVMHYSGADEVISRDDKTSLPPDIYWCMLASLPRWLGTTLDNLPPPFRPPTPTSTGGGIGFRAQGNPTNPTDARRSLPRVASLTGATMLEPAGDILDSFRMVAGLDLVITVDTAWAHIAASLGKPTWILLDHKGDWRWLSGRSDSPWYPSARLFRQRTPGDWRGVLAEVQAALAAKNAEGPPAGARPR